MQLLGNTAGDHIRNLNSGLLINLWIQTGILCKGKVGIRKSKIDDAVHDTMSKVVLRPRSTVALGVGESD